MSEYFLEIQFILTIKYVIDLNNLQKDYLISIREFQ